MSTQLPLFPTDLPNFDPPSTFESRLRDFESTINEQGGLRSAFGDESSEGDSEGELEWKRRERKKVDMVWKGEMRERNDDDRGGKGKGRDTARDSNDVGTVEKGKKETKGVNTKESSTRKSTNDDQVVVVANSSKRKRQPLSFGNAPSESEHTATAGPPGIRHPSRIGNSERDQSEPRPPREAELTEIIEVSSDSDTTTANHSPEKKKQKTDHSNRLSSPPPIANSRNTSPTKKKPSTRSTAISTTKKKPRQSLEQALEQAQKIKPEQLKLHYPDISSFIDHLSSFERKGTSKLLQRCRVCFVNVDHWMATDGDGEGEGTRKNRLDQGLRLEMGIVLKRGGSLVKPQDFEAPPPSSLSSLFEDASRSKELEETAEREGWTTHLIPFSPTNKRPPSFPDILSALGPIDEGGITIEELGRYVKVVKFQWVSECVKRNQRQPEWEFAVSGDPRSQKSRSGASSRVSSTKSSPVKKGQEAKSFAAKRKKGPIDQQGTTDEERDDFEDDDDVDPGRDISPFGLQDYPAGEQPPHLVNAEAGPSGLPRFPPSSSPSNESRDPQIDPLSRQNLFTTDARMEDPNSDNVLEGLEQQDELIRALGSERVDLELEELGQLNASRPGQWWEDEQGGKDVTRDDVIFSKMGGVDDCETEEEEEDERIGGNGKGKKKDKMLEKRKDRGGYVVNQEPNVVGKVSVNDDTAKVLIALSELHKGDLWRERGYRMAAAALKSCANPVRTYEDARKLPGIGESIAKKIVEIYTTGTHRKLTLELPQDKAARIFSTVYGIGLNGGRQLFTRGAKTLDDLRSEEFYSTLTVDQRIGLDYHDDLQERIPRSEVTQLFEVVCAAAKSIDPKLVIECMGSYRRGQPDSGDIDILVSRDPSDGKTHSGAIGKFYNILKEQGFFKHVLSESADWSALDCKVNGLCMLASVGKMRRIDILGVPWDELPAALIYFTGNDHYNRSLRLKARHMGYSLNQRGLYKSVIRNKGGVKLTEGTKIETKSERDIFRILKVPWRPPEQRIPS